MITWFSFSSWSTVSFVVGWAVEMYRIPKTSFVEEWGRRLLFFFFISKWQCAPLVSLGVCIDHVFYFPSCHRRLASSTVSSKEFFLRWKLPILRVRRTMIGGPYRFLRNFNILFSLAFRSSWVGWRFHPWRTFFILRIWSIFSLNVLTLALD